MNYERSDIEQHPWKPFYPKGATLLLLGSFPPPKKRWSINFYYPNWQNDMWRILGLIFFNDLSFFEIREKKMFDEKKIRKFLTEKKIALSDVALQAIRGKGNASDQYLEVIESIDLKRELDLLPQCRIIVSTGQKSCDVLNRTFSRLLDRSLESPTIGNYREIQWDTRSIRWYRMPSSSRAYPKSIQEKALMYQKLFEV